MTSDRPRILFVTGKLAEPALRDQLARLRAAASFDADVLVLNITVAALMTPRWLMGKIVAPTGASRIVLPGWCLGDLTPLQESLPSVPIVRGPKDLADLPDFFRLDAAPENDEPAPIDILAEINNSDQWRLDQLVAHALQWRDQGADVIDLGMTPGQTWPDVDVAVKELVAEGIRVSIDSFDPIEVQRACAAGAELVLSVNASNREQAPSWNAEVVVIPDQPAGEHWLDEMARTVDVLDRHRIRWRLDPVLEPIGLGFARSLGRYLETRRRFPEAAMMMGVGNLTELTEVDSAGVNALLMGFCAELGIGSVLTTQVANWARSSVRELVAARQLMGRAVRLHQPPKRGSAGLVMLRDPRLTTTTPEALASLHAKITDPNYRIFAHADQITVMNRNQFEQGKDPFELFERLSLRDPAHAFYLGWEMHKAALSLQLGKRYTQDEALRWGLLTEEEVSHRARREIPS